MSDAVKRSSMCEQAIFWLHIRAIRQYEWVHDHQVRGIFHTTCKLYAKLDRTDINCVTVLRVRYDFDIPHVTYCLRSKNFKNHTLMNCER